ncbi:RNA polymerase sigma factor [Carboxylicivirga mesophila]|uniref:RNA polymerase sigma factor n=1 Tax=Carboxylicivirga mesophila TaxID=1166478 RepID=A0ABS5K862_9BACT|nr:RNA polymerase sigma factor [Carboxylicivirga mesophila]MBS2211184.1 RNA polymerase sigma factor [Carboxylicivirga mesophila]
MINEIELIDQINQGDTAAFRQLLELHHRKVIHICLSFVNDPHDAEDIAQEVFIEMFRSLKNFRKDASVSTWLYRLSVNKSLDFIRQSKRQKRGSGKVGLMEKNDLERLSISNRQMPSDGMEEDDKKKLLYMAIEQLPERQKKAIILSQIKELKQQEVAEIMETTIASVESLLVRAKRKLKETLIRHKEEFI